MHKCNNKNDNDGNGTDDNCSVADDVINDALDFPMALANCNIALNDNGGDDDDLIHNKDGDNEIDSWEEEEEEYNNVSENDFDIAMTLIQQ